jgi:SAM-dependent methyltransferase
MGLDASPEMLRIAQRRLPGVRLVLDDMRTFRLRRRFDVVSCLFSAIAHLQTKEDVRRTFANFARHLNPGGVAIVEPWLGPGAFQPGYLSLRTHLSPTVAVARLAYSARRGNHSVVHFHFLIGEDGHKPRYVAVTDVGLLLSRNELLQLLSDSGLAPHYLTRGFTPGRGLLVGVKTRAG